MLDQGLNLITGKSVKLECPPEVIYEDPVTGVRSLYYKITVTRGVSYQELRAMRKDG